MYNVCAKGTPTKHNAVYKKADCLCNLQFQQPEFDLGDGDGFVLLGSALDDSYQNSKKIVLEGVKHAQLTQEGVLGVIWECIVE